jgi:PhzF family phenazine biosynthesis protein
MTHAMITDRTLPFLQVDVFTDRPFFGNPVAVVLDADGLDGEAMQRIARWTNLSETTFVVRPTAADADYALRIFTPDRELPFAGHPTLGTARALLATGRVAPRDGRLVQQCAAGLVRLRVDGEQLFFEVPVASVTAVPSSACAALAAALGLPGPAPRFDAIDVGPVWLTAELRDAAQVLALRPDLAALADLSRTLGATGVTVHAPFGPDAHAGRRADVAVRSFAPAAGVPEDPVCGSGNACVAVQRAAAGRRRGYVAAQGKAIGRDGFIAIAYPGDAIEVGGQALVCVEGRLRID